MFYEYFLKPILFKVKPESAHNLAAKALRGPLAGPFLACNQAFNGYRSERLRTDICGIPLDHPIGLAAGFDKNAEMYPSLQKLGFSFIEVGTVTKHPQEGNPLPRLFRLPADEALINRMGFDNHGAKAAAERIAKKAIPAPLGGNIGKSKITPLEEAVDDYLYSFEQLKPHVDYFVVNVSSPNTPNLRKLQAREPLQELLSALQEKNTDPALPLLLKIAPDLNEDQLVEIVEVVVASKIDGVIATNTTIERSGLQTPASAVEAIGAGGLSGKPVRERATKVVAFLRRNLPEQVAVVGVGGIASGRDAYEKILHGAACVQVYTGFVYGGHASIFKMVRELDALLKADGHASVKDAVGKAL